MLYLKVLCKRVQCAHCTHVLRVRSWTLHVQSIFCYNIFFFYSFHYFTHIHCGRNNKLKAGKSENDNIPTHHSQFGFATAFIQRISIEKNLIVFFSFRVLILRTLSSLCGILCFVFCQYETSTNINRNIIKEMMVLIIILFCSPSFSSLLCCAIVPDEHFFTLVGIWNLKQDKAGIEFASKYCFNTIDLLSTLRIYVLWYTIVPNLLTCHRRTTFYI